MVWRYHQVEVLVVVGFGFATTLLTPQRYCSDKAVKKIVLVGIR